MTSTLNFQELQNKVATLNGLVTAMTAPVLEEIKKENAKREAKAGFESSLESKIEEEELVTYLAEVNNETSALLTKVSYERNAVVFEEIKKIVDSALRATFIDENITLFLNEKKTGSRQDLEIHTMENGRLRDIKVGNGKAVRQFIEMLFRCILIILYGKNKPVSRFIVCDEELSGIHFTIAPAVTQILKDMHEKNGFDFIFVEQKDALWECGIGGINVIKLAKTNGKLVLAEQFITKDAEGLYVERLAAGEISDVSHEPSLVDGLDDAETTFDSNVLVSFDIETGAIYACGEEITL